MYSHNVAHHGKAALTRIALALASCFALSANAETFLIDFNTTQTAGAYPGADGWNVYAAPANIIGGAMSNTAGSTASGVTLAYTGDLVDSTGVWAWNSNGPAWVAASRPAGDFFWTGQTANNVESFTLIIGGVATGSIVSVDLFASRSSALAVSGYYEYSTDGGGTWSGFTVLTASGGVESAGGWDANDTLSQAFDINADGFNNGRSMNVTGIVAHTSTLRVRTTDAGLASDANAYSGINAIRLRIDEPITSGPDIAVVGMNGGLVVNGDITPATLDGTDFGSLSISGLVTHTFTITNTGTGLLTLTGTPRVAVSGSHADDFQVTAQPAETVPAGAGSTFAVQFSPSAAGLRQASLTIWNDDPDENPYTFAVQGTGATPSAGAWATTDATFSGAVTPGTPESITGDAIATALATAEGVFTNLQGATAFSISTANALNSLGTPPGSAEAAVTGLSANDGVNNLASGNFQFTNGFDANTRFFILESAPQSSTIGDAATVYLIGANHGPIGTLSLNLAATNFTASPANTTNTALATLTYTAGQGTPAQKLGGVMFALAHFSGSGDASLATGIRIVSASVLDPNVVGMTSTTGSFPPPPPPPPPAPPAVEILFVGNSYTHGSFAPLITYNSAAITDANGTGHGGVPGMFKQLTVSAGLSYNVTIEAVSGESLAFHNANRTGIIFQAKWNKIFLQDHSTGPLPAERGGNRTAFQNAVNALEAGIHAANPHTDIFLYETFPRSGLTYPAGQPYSGEPIETMAADLHEGYYGMLALNAGIHAVSPAGDAWIRAIQQDVADRNPYDGIDAGKVNLWAGDNHHASAHGCFLNALVHFGAATGVDPRTLGFEQTAIDLGIASNAAISLQQIAYQTLTNAGTRPVVSLGGTNPLTIALSETYTDPGATAVDVEDGALSPAIAQNTVMPGAVGTYLVRWEAVNSAGLTGSATRLVSVVDTNTPAMRVLGIDGSDIVNGDVTPDAGEGTFFGAHDLTTAGAAHVFIVTNAGAGTLLLTGAPAVKITGAAASDFTVAAQPDGMIAPGAASTFTIHFKPTAVGTRQAMASIPNNDDENNPHTFSIEGEGAFDNGAYPRRVRIEFGGYGRAEVLTNFPALVQLGGAITNFNYDDFLGVAGGDLRFTDDSFSRLLHHEIETWNTNGTSFVWVQVPALAGSTTAVWALWGNPAATAAPAYTTNGATWSEHFIGVWHLGEGGGLFMDSVSTNHGVLTDANGNAVRGTNSLVGRGVQFVGSEFDFIEIANEPNFRLTSNFTLMVVAKGLSGNGWAPWISKNGETGGYALRRRGVSSPAAPDWVTRGLSNGEMHGPNIDGTNWHSIAGSLSGGAVKTKRLFIDGAIAVEATNVTGTITATPDNVLIGARTNVAAYWGGVIDEVRISRVERSTNWVWAEFANIASNASFNLYGPVEESEHSFPDSDGDGLPDSWELLYGLDPTVSNAPESMADADWMTDFEEYIADTNPTNALSFFPPAALAPSQQPGVTTFVIDPTSTGRVYGLYKSTNLISLIPEWSLATGEKTGSGFSVSFVVTNDSLIGHYRTGVRLP